MRKVGLVSWEAGTGQNTVAVNMAIGLSRQGHRVIIINLNHNLRIYQWLGANADEKNVSFDHIYSSNEGVDFIYPAAGREFQSEGFGYDYAILNIGGDENFCEQGIGLCDLIIVCTRLRNSNECDHLLSLETKVKRYRQDGRGVDLIMPLQIHSGEWKINSERIFELAEVFGEDKIADFLPHCERIHDLFIEKKSVWKLTQPAIIEAFDRMLERIEHLK